MPAILQTLCREAIWWFMIIANPSFPPLLNVLILLFLCLVWVTDPTVRDHVGCFTLGTVLRTKWESVSVLCFPVVGTVTDQENPESWPPSPHLFPS